MGVQVVPGRHERLLDGPGRGPAEQVEWRAGLVVGAGRPAATEGLLADDGARAGLAKAGRARADDFTWAASAAAHAAAYTAALDR